MTDRDDMKEKSTDTAAKRRVFGKTGRLSRRFAAAFALLLILTAAFAYPPASADDARARIDADDENIVYMGRWKEDGDLMRGSFECGLLLRFTGTSVGLDGPASGTALIAVDGGEPEQITLGDGVSLFAGLAEGEHTLELYAGAQQTFPAISGFSLDAGAAALTSPGGRIVEFVGDSITEGYVAPADAAGGANNSYKNSYAFIVGRRLMKKYGFRFSTVAYGGISIVERGKNTLGTDPLGMPERYFLDREYMRNATPEEERAAAQAWDTSKYAPDFIVINLGTNDTFSDTKTVAAATLQYLTALREAYKDAVIFVMTPFNGTASTALRRAVDLSEDAGIVLINTKSWDIKAGSDWLHPDPSEHGRAAELLYEVLKPYAEAPDTPADTDTYTDAPDTDTPTAPATDAGLTEAGETDGDEGGGKTPYLPYIISGAVIVAALSASIIVIKKTKK